MTTRIIAFLNFKGGTGKTTSCINIAYSLSKSSKKVLLIDCDPQGSASSCVDKEYNNNLYHLLRGEIDFTSCAYKINDHFDIIPSNKTLFAAEIELNSKPGRETVLKEKLAPIIKKFDYILLDCSPALSIINYNVLGLANEVFIPVSTDFLSLTGINKVYEVVNLFKNSVNPLLKVTGIIPTFYDKRTKASIEAYNFLKSNYKTITFNPIRINTQLKEAPSYKKSIFEFAPSSRGSNDYKKLGNSIIKMGDNCDKMHK